MTIGIIRSTGIGIQIGDEEILLQLDSDEVFERYSIHGLWLNIQ